MRWVIKEKVRPTPGDTRTVSRFLWFPRKIGREMVWLETVQVKQIYDYSWALHKDYEWCNMEFFLPPPPKE